MKNIKYLCLDVGDTLLYKPLFIKNLIDVLHDYSIEIKERDLTLFHKRLLELITLPDVTSKEFYLEFNERLLLMLGILPSKKISKAIYDACCNLQWEKFEDTDVLEELNIKKGIISNWNTSLEKKLDHFFSTRFSVIVGSESVDLRKPDIAIYELAVRELNCDPGEIIYIGDSIKLDIIPSLKIGMKAILIDRENLYPFYKGIRIKSLHELKPMLNHFDGICI